MINRRRTHTVHVLLNDAEFELWKRVFEARQEAAERVLGAAKYTQTRFLIEAVQCLAAADEKDRA